MIIDFFKGFIVGLLASIPLGPIGVICIQRTLSKGRFSGFISGMGATMVDVIFAAISLLSLSVVQVLLEEYRNVVMIAGGVIVALFGVKLFLSTPIKQMRRLQEGGRSFLTDFSSTMLMTITNPGAFFLILGLFAFAGINTSDSATLDYIAVTLLGVFTGGGLWWYSLSTGINLFRNKIRLRQMILINKVAGIIVIAIGFCYLVEGVYKLLV
jgi:threonine/homoserine/homoserine lactone efflux protein